MEFSLKSIDLNIFGNEFTLESYLPKTCNTDVYLKYIEYELSSMLRDEIINYFNGCRYNLLFDLSIHEDIKKRASFRFLKNDIDLYSKLDEKANHIVNFIEEQYPHIFNKKIGYIAFPVMLSFIYHFVDSKLNEIETEQTEIEFLTKFIFGTNCINTVKLAAIKIISILTKEWNIKSNHYQNLVARYQSETYIVQMNLSKVNSLNARTQLNYRVSKYKDHQSYQYESLKKFINILNYIPTREQMHFRKNKYGMIFEQFLKKNIKIEDLEDIYYLENDSWFCDKHGTWTEVLIDNDILEGGRKNSKYGVFVKAVDGHLCRSIAEKNVDDWLTYNNIKHEKEVKYPNSKFIADWKVHDYYIELFGLKGNEDYDIKTQKKIEFSKNNNMKLIELYLSDIDDLKIKLGFLIDI